MKKNESIYLHCHYLQIILFIIQTENEISMYGNRNFSSISFKVLMSVINAILCNLNVAMHYRKYYQLC